MPPPQDPSPDRLPEIVDRVFAADGPLARTLAAFEPRDSQRQMAAAVAETLETGGVLLAEAGTGTGKTLAYLAPAILKGERVLVSTGTRNLQEQIYFKDLPTLARSLGVRVTATCMKGRGNYLCVHRFEALRHDLTSGGAVHLPGFGNGPDPADLLPVIARWAARTDTGDRAELEDLPENLPLWSTIAASAENCLGTGCPRYHDCFVTKMRQRAGESDVVIVNHHLLFADAALRQHEFGEVIPDCQHAVLDEAHQLEEVATQYFGIAVSNWRLEDVAADVERWAGRVLRSPQREAVAGGVDHLRRRARSFFRSLDALRRGPEERVRYTSELPDPIVEAALEVDGTLEGLEATLRLLEQAPGGETIVSGGDADELRSLARRAAEIRGDLRFLLRASNDEFVYFLERRGQGVFLRAAPIDVAVLVHDTVIAKRATTVLTSATLSVDGSFDYLRQRLGIGRARELRLPSEFDFERQALLYLPRHMPSPKSPLFADAASREIAAILQGTKGRAFVLFTSYAMLRHVQQALASTLEYPLLVQGTAPRSALLARFRETAHAVLLATSSFWQGVDVAGDALSCVIVDKLPFASPADPITAARLEAIAARGGDPFSDYQVPLAILTLQQGLGRLLRHRLDRGVLAILDPRLRTMGYGRRFLASLPPARVTTDPRDVVRFFAQDR